MQQPAPPIGRGTKLLYGAGAIAYGVKEGGFSYFLLFYYSQVIGLPAGGVSAALAAALVVDAILDIGIGQTSDNWRSRLGRRHPFMYAAALPAAVAYALLWNPPAWSETWLLAYLAVLMIVIRGCLAAYEIPSNALVAELTSDYTERTSFFSYRFFFTSWGGGAVTLFTLAFLMRPDATHSVGQLNPAGYSTYGILAGLVILASILAAAIGTHNRIPYLRPPPPRRPFRARQVAAEMFGTLSSKSLVVMMLAAITANIGIGLGAGLMIYVNTYFWGLTSDQLALLVPAAFIGPAVGVVAAPRLAKRFGKRESAIAVAIIAVTFSLGPLGLRLLGWFPPNGAPALLPMLFGCQVIYTGMGVCNQVLIFAMLTDVVEESELKTGRRSEGLVLAANTFVIKCVTGLGILISGFLVSLAGFPKHAAPDQLNPSIINHLVLLYMPAQCLLFFTAFFFLSRYRISQRAHEDNLRQLAERAAAHAPDGADDMRVTGASSADRPSTTVDGALSVRPSRLM